MNQRKATVVQKEYGGVSNDFTHMASKEALEGKGGMSAAGGIVTDAAWDDDVAQFDFNQDEDDSEADLVLDVDQPLADAGAVAYVEESLEAIAGVASTEPETEAEASPQPPSEGPPLPATGLPDGWTMDQWQWYGQEYLEKMGLN